MDYLYQLRRMLVFVCDAGHALASKWNVCNCENKFQTRSSDFQPLQVSTFLIRNMQAFRRGEVRNQLFVEVSTRKSRPILRVPLNLVIVLDTSESMGGHFLVCKESIKLLLSQLHYTDNVSLVTFDDVIDVFHFMKMTGEGISKMQEVVDSIRILENTTSRRFKKLGSGLFSAIELLKKQRCRNRSRRTNDSVLLFTNGSTNQLDQKDVDLVKLSEEILNIPSLSIYTFGYGCAHDAQFLRILSDHGSGMYYWISSEKCIPAAIGACLGNLLSTVVQNISLKISSPYTLILSKRTSSENGEVRTFSGKTISFDLGDLCDGESRDLLIAIEPHIQHEKMIKSIECKVEFLDLTANTNKSAYAQVQDLKLNFIQNGSSVEERLVSAQSRVCAAIAIEKSMETASRGFLGIARRIIRTAASEIHSYNEAVPFTSTFPFVESLEECMHFLLSKHLFQSKGIKKLTSLAECYWKQRYNQITPALSDAPCKEFYQNKFSFKMQKMIGERISNEFSLKVAIEEPEVFQEDVDDRESRKTLSKCIKPEILSDQKEESYEECLTILEESSMLCPYYEGKCSFGPDYSHYAPF